MGDHAIVADAAMYHDTCARRLYGDQAIDRALSGGGDPDQDQYGIMGPEWPVDRDGNYITVVHAQEWEDMDDLHDETGQPGSCGACLGYLVEDTRAPESPISQEILNLTVDTYDQNLNRMLSHAASVAAYWDTDPDELIRRMSDWHYGASAWGYGAIAWSVAQIIAEWVEKYSHREIVALTTDDSGMLIDSDGNEYSEYDMRGYLDMYADGTATCESCGRGIVSHCYHVAEWDDGAYCVDCVTVDA